jgi:hypothetical protein
MKRIFVLTAVLLCTVLLVWAATSTSKQLSITINPAPPAPLVISTASLPNGNATVAYSTTLTAIGGVAPYSWSITAGSLPPGLTLNATTGAISGIPTTQGQYTFTVTVTDSNASSASVTVKADTAPGQ